MRGRPSGEGQGEGRDGGDGGEVEDEVVDLGKVEEGLDSKWSGMLKRNSSASREDGFSGPERRRRERRRGRD